MTTKNKPQTKQPEQRRASIEDVLAELRQPVSPQAPKIRNLADVKRLFSLPATLGTKGIKDSEPDSRIALDHAFAAGFEQIYQSLVQHGTDLGQYPMTSFIGYGVLQQIAQNGMIRTCIQTVADDITREWIDITGGDETDPDKIKQITERCEKLKLRKIFNTAVATMGYMGGAFIYIDTGTDDPSIPLQISEKSDEIKQGTELKLVVIDPVNCAPGTYNAIDPLKSSYMSDPDYWLILGKRVHASRLVILRDNLPPTLLRPAYNFLGIPMAQILWDYVMHWNRARVATSGILEKLNLLVFQTNTEDLLSQPQGVQQLDAKMLALSRYRDNDSVVVCDKTAEDIKNITLTISGVVDVVRQSLEFIAAINRTPAVKLLGISPSGFNATGESDIRNYYDHIMSKQELLHDGILRILRAIQLSVLGEIDQSINFEFNPLGTEDETGDIESASARVNMLATLLQANVISADEARQAVKDDPKAKLGFLSDDAPEPNMGAMMPEMANQLQAAQEQQQSAPQEPQQAQGNASDVDLTGNPRAWMFQEPPHPKFEGREWMLGGRADATVTSAESEQA